MAARGAGALPVLGLIVPPALPWTPEEGLALYKGRVRFLAEGLGLARLTPEGYDSVVDKVAPLAERLAGRGAKAIVLMGTSLSFYKGAAFNRRLTESMERASGLPAITMSTAVVMGLRAVAARRIAVATAYNETVNARLAAFLKENDLDPLLVEGLNIEDIAKVETVSPETLVAFGAHVAARAPDADALLLSCGGLKTLDVLEPLEDKAGLPVISSTHAYWAGMRLLGVSARRIGYGTLLEQPALR
jgi:arylmalonate decarboxylase